MGWIPRMGQGLSGVRPVGHGMTSATSHVEPLLTLLGEHWDPVIADGMGRSIGKLQALAPGTTAIAEPDSPLIETLCAWRNEHRDCFLNTPLVTLASTHRWLNALVGSPDRLMFLAFNEQGAPVAQYGLRRLEPAVVELDNGILGVRGQPADLFLRIQTKLLELCKNRLGFTEARAQVLANNIPALFLHRRCGLQNVPEWRRRTPEGREVLVMRKMLTDSPQPT